MSLKLWIGLAMVVGLVGCRPTPAVANKHLYEACAAKNLSDVKQAIAEGADVNLSLRDEDFRYSPLEAAVQSPEIVEALLKAGAAPKKADARGLFPLGMAAAAGDTKSVELILKWGALLEGKDADGETALARAAGAGKLENAKFLVNCGANVNAKDRLGYTPLFHAVIGPMLSSLDRTEMARFLIDHGANIAIIDNKGRTAANYAQSTFARPTGATQALIDLLTNPVPKLE